MSDRELYVSIDHAALHGTSMYDVLCLRGGADDDPRMEVCASFDTLASADRYARDTDHGEYVIAVRPPYEVMKVARAWVAFAFAAMSDDFDAPYTSQYRRTY